MAKRDSSEHRTELGPIGKTLVQAADNLVTPAAHLVGDTLSQSARVVEVATGHVAKLISPEGGGSITSLVGDTVEESIKVGEVATRRAWELVGSFFGEASRVARSFREVAARAA